MPGTSHNIVRNPISNDRRLPGNATTQQYANIKMKIDSVMKELKNARDELDNAAILIQQNYQGNSADMKNILKSIE